MTRLRKYKLLSESEKEREVRAQQVVEAGGWLQVFDGIGDLWLEVGTGKDTHLLERAKLYPLPPLPGISRPDPTSRIRRMLA